MLFPDQPAWEAWLSKNFDSSPGVWMRIAKAAGPLRSVTYPQAIEGALCHGWIDGQKKALDEESWLQKFTPRGTRSIWSKINREKALALIEQGRMAAAGVAAVERAKANGQWDGAYDSPKTAAPPEDFLAALAKNKKAKAFFATLESRNRYAVLWRIQTAKKAETRERRIAQLVEMLAKGEKLYP